MKAHGEKRVFVGSLLRPILIGTAIGIAACVVVLLLLAATMASGVFPAKAVTPLALAAGAAGALIGGFFAARIAGSRGLLYGAGCGLLLFLLTVLAGFAMLPDAGGTLFLLKAALMIGAGALGGIFGVNLKRRR